MFYLDEQQNLNEMVISYPPELKSGSNKENYKDLKNICKNSVFRNDMVYKDCSYRLSNISNAEKKINSKTGNPSKKPTLKNSTINNNNQFSWSKVYKSPTTRRHIDEKHKNIVIEYNITDIQNKQLLNNEKFTDPQTKMDERDIVEVITQAVGTSVTSIPKPSLRRPTCFKYSLPKLLCPCCCGGEDNIDRNQSAESYETINLKTVSNIYFPTLDLDPSLMSIIQLHGHLKARKSSKLYASITKVLLRAIIKCKNSIGIFKSLKKI